MKDKKPVLIVLMLVVTMLVLITACNNEPDAAVPGSGGTAGSFTIWVPSASDLQSSPSSKGLTDLIDSGNVFDTGNPSFDLYYAEAVMQCMPLFSRLEKVDVVSSTTRLEDLKGSLQYSLYGYSFVPDMTKTRLNEDGIYVYCKAYEGDAAEDKNPVGIVEYYYNFEKNRLTYRQYVMLTIDVMEVGGMHIMNNGVLVYCLDDVAVAADGTLAVNQLKADGTLETKEAYTDYLWLGDNLNLTWYESGAHGDVSDFIATYCYKAGFERRVMTFKNDAGITAAFSQPGASFSSVKVYWSDVDDDDPIKVLMHSKAQDYRITESNKDVFTAETAIGFARLLYSNGDSIAKGGWTRYEDFADASLLTLRTDDFEWLFNEDIISERTVNNGTFWMSYFDSDNATTGDKTKRAYYDALIVDSYGSDQPYRIGTQAYQNYGFSNLFGAYSADDTGNAAVTKTVLTKFLPYCLKAASGSQITALVERIMSVEGSSQDDQPTEPDQPSEPEHTHTFSDIWKYDTDYHWHAATCDHKDLISDNAPHSWKSDTWIISKPATLEEDGEEYNECTVCGHKITRVIPMLEDPMWVISSEGAVSPRDKSLISGNVTIPGKVNGKTVVEIEDNAFRSCESLTGITIPDSVASIGDSAFYECTGIADITIPESVTSIGTEAFYGCSKLKEITVLASSLSNYLKLDFGSLSWPYTLTVYLNGALISGKVEIPSDVTSIPARAFYGCTGITGIVIPSSVTSIGWDAFYGCIPESVVNNSDVKLNCTFDSETYKLLGSPSVLKVSEVYSEIGWHAFYNCAGLTGITMSDNVKSIGESAFSGCTGITGITIPDSVISIGPSAFEGCTGLTGIIIPDSVTSIGSSCFSDCTNLASVVIPDTVTSIGDCALRGCSSLESIDLPDSVTSIGTSAFAGCTGFTSISIPASVTTIGSGAFSGCTGLSGIIIWDSLTDIDPYAFSGCELDTVSVYAESLSSYLKMNLGESVSANTLKLYIDGELLSGDVEIPSDITSIPEKAFWGITGITGMVIPDSVTSIGAQAFYGCTGLKNITIGKSVEEIGWKAFDGCYPDTFVNGSSVQLDYSFGSSDYEYLGSPSELTISGIFTSIERFAFRECTGLTAVTIPDSVTNIGESAFYGCTGLTSVVMGNSVTSIGSASFYGCSSLTEISIPDSVESIGENAFYGCTGATSITIGKSVTSIGSGAFYGCYPDDFENRSSVDLNRSFSINDYTLLGSPSELTISGIFSSIGSYALQNCTNLTSITIPDSVTSIGASAFYGCTGLTSITIPDSVTSIGASAFYGCTGLTSITIPDSVTSIGGYAFYGTNPAQFANNSDVKLDYSFGTSEYGNIGYPSDLVISDLYTSIPEAAFYGRTTLTSITITSSVTSIGASAFNGCTSLADISFSGTKSQWSTVKKESYWNYNIPATVVHCSDGDVDL